MAATDDRSKPAHESIYGVVARIPRGCVATYGQVALLAGLPRSARQVGLALRELPDSRPIPWHRVVNASGTISPRADPVGEQIQRALLEHEGVRVDGRGRVALRMHQWKARS